MVIAEKYDGGVKTHLEIIANSLKVFDVCKVILRGELHPASQGLSNDEDIFLENFSMKNPYQLMKNMRMIKKIVIEKKIDLIHLHSTVAGFTGVLLAALLWNRKIKFVYTPHAYYSQKPDLNAFKRRFIILIEKLICFIPSKIIHVSRGEESHALSNNIVNKQKSVVIYNGIKKRIKVNRDSPQTLVIGNLARVDFQKNPHRFLEIASHVVRTSKTPIQFVFGGDGPLLEEMKSLVLKEKLEKNIEFIGYVEDIDAFFNGIDGYLSTSYYEGLPYSVVEAASFGIPLFLSDVIGHNEMIKGNGMLFDLHENNSQIAESILEIIERKEIAEAQGRESYKIFEQLFEEKRMIEHLSNLYTGEIRSL